MDKNLTSVIVLGANGRMGKAVIEAIKDDEAFSLAGAADLKPIDAAIAENIAVGTSLADVLAKGVRGAIIDFSSPDATMNASEIAAEYGLPLVVGTTGLSRVQLDRLSALATKTPILRSANMSVGVNALLRFLPTLAKALGPSYDMEIVEMHHKHKKDAPSGTALMLADALAKSRGWELDEAITTGRDGAVGERSEKELGVMALRGGDVAGVHDCFFFGTGEIIEIKHIAESRANFAQGALRAAKWLKDRRPGKLYSMLDVIEDPNVNE